MNRNNIYSRGSFTSGFLTQGLGISEFVPKDMKAQNEFEEFFSQIQKLITT
jgi:hypothetical protein